jgi:hypothetical protein
VTVGDSVTHHAVAAVTNGTPLLGLPVLRHIGHFAIDAAHERLILYESTQCKTPFEGYGAPTPAAAPAAAPAPRWVAQSLGRAFPCQAE